MGIVSKLFVTCTIVVALIGCTFAADGSRVVDNSLSPKWKAFLDMIAFAEGTKIPLGYNTIFTHARFSSFADHPRQRKCSGRLCSDASGRYQFLSTTWKGVKSRVGATDFSPINQDRAAVQLVKNRGAGADVEAGRIQKAIEKCSWEWASFPPGRYGQPVKTMSQMLAEYNKNLQYYEGKGGNQSSSNNGGKRPQSRPTKTGGNTKPTTRPQSRPSKSTSTRPQSRPSKPSSTRPQSRPTSSGRGGRRCRPRPRPNSGKGRSSSPGKSSSKPSSKSSGKSSGKTPGKSSGKSSGKSQNLPNVGSGSNCGMAYTNGKPMGNKSCVKIDGKNVVVATAQHFNVMKAAARSSGVTLRINSGFRTQSEQTYFYNCYRTKRCNGGNLAARPGYSNHQNGIALDINTPGPVYTWLRNNAAKYGFIRTVSSEIWHWEYRPGQRCNSMVSYSCK